MKEWQIRVANFTTQTMVYLNHLNSFVGSEEYELMNEEERYLVCKQRDQMAALDQTQQKRVSNFG